jgi:hypothetical protein
MPGDSMLSGLGPSLPGGDDEQRVVLGAQLVDGLGHRVVRRVLDPAAEAHADDPCFGRRPLHAGDDVGFPAGAVVPEDLADQQVGVRGDTPALAVRRGTRTRDRRGDVRAVAVPVGGVRALAEVSEEMRGLPTWRHGRWPVPRRAPVPRERA